MFDFDATLKALQLDKAKDRFYVAMQTPEEKLGSKLASFLTSIKHKRAIFGPIAMKAAVELKPRSLRAR